MENDMITKRVYLGEYAGSSSVGRLWKRWIDTVKDCWKKRGLDVRQARRMVHDRSVWQGFLRGECMGRCPVDEPLTMTSCYSLMKPWRVEIRLWPSPQFKSIKGKITFFVSFSFTNLLLSLILWHDACRPRGSGRR